MQVTVPLAFDLGAARVVITGRADGDFASPALRPGREPDGGVEAGRRRRAVVDLPWRTLHQVHGSGVVVCEAATAGEPEPDGDALVTADPGLALAVRTADCAPVALAGDNGVVGVVHAGWRGLAGGVVDAAVAAMGRLGAGRMEAVVGPCICAACYEFSAGDLESVAARLGDEVRGATASGQPALDLRGGVHSALRRHGVAAGDAGGCTACEAGGTSWFSHRARGETARQAMVVWRA